MELLPQLLTLLELADLLHLDPRTIRRWASAGTFPQPIRLGGALRWPAPAVADWLAARAEDVPAPRPRPPVGDTMRPLKPSGGGSRSSSANSA